VIGYLDVPGIQMEIQRVTPQMLEIGQDPDAMREMIASLLDKSPTGLTHSSLRMRFLASPVKIIGDENGHVCGLEVEQTMLVRTDKGETVAHGMGLFQTLAVDTVIFAIGDQVDSSLGLPFQGTEFIKNPSPRFPQDGMSFEAYDPNKQTPTEDIFVAGWARKASTGVVGLARKDGTNGAHALLQYLTSLPPQPANAEPLLARLATLNKPLVRHADLIRLEEVEQSRAVETDHPGFKFESNLEMLQVMGLVHPIGKDYD
jgi:ferredoxin--NADP+ reductase